MLTWCIFFRIGFLNGAVALQNAGESAALEKLHGKLIGNKHVVVRLAKNISYGELERPKPKIEIPVLAAGASKDQKISKEVTIQAIEAKLKLLETRRDDFEVNRTATGEIPLIQKYKFNKMTHSSSGGDPKKSSTSSFTLSLFENKAVVASIH